ncbi:MAG: SH3 domain-containing protein [Oscillospiraceae bacterium]|jgi:uncharacterized protein YgiM (DUF1202 family)|nr:SH3 domain-containing protein [Oscillospiraceae bacterium]
MNISYTRRVILAALCVIISAIPLGVLSAGADIVSVGAAIISVDDTPVFTKPLTDDDPIEEATPYLIAINTEVAVLTGGGEWAQIAYYSPKTLVRMSGWVQAANLFNLRSHLVPGPNYINLHDGAFVLRTPEAQGYSLGRLSASQQLDVVSSTSDWVQIVYRHDGISELGWVKRPYVVPEFAPLAATPMPLAVLGVTEEPQNAAVPAAPAATMSPSDRTTSNNAAHTVTLNASDPSVTTTLRRTPDAYGVSAGEYYNGAVGEYLSYVEGWVEVRVGMTRGYFPAASVWVDAPAGSVPSALPSTTVNVNSRLNLRQDASTRYDEITKLDPGTELEVLGRMGPWLHIRTADTSQTIYVGYVYDEFVGRLSMRFVELSAIPENPAFNGVLETAEVVDYTEQTKGEGQDADLPSEQGASPTATAQVSPPFSAAAYPQLPPYAVIGSKSGGKLNLRREPGTESLSLGLYNAGVRVAIDARYDETWVLVSIGTASGYMALEYLNLNAGGAESYYTYPDNVPRAYLTQYSTAYAGPSDLADTVGSYGAGTAVIVLGEYTVWKHVSINGKMGYVKSESVSR